MGQNGRPEGVKMHHFATWDYLNHYHLFAANAVVKKTYLSL